MENLPKGMTPDKDNIVYYDPDKGLLYFIEWEETGNNDIPHRHYFQVN